MPILTNQNDIAVRFTIHCGILRTGHAFIETDLLENVLGDVPHKECLESISRLGVLLMNRLMEAHFGEELSPEKMQEILRDDDLLSFFDQNRDISDD